MRDPNRIPRILSLLTAIWRDTPDLRLGQIVENARSLAAPLSKADTFYVEDDIIEEGLRKLLGMSPRAILDTLESRQ